MYGSITKSYLGELSSATEVINVYSTSLQSYLRLSLLIIEVNYFPTEDDLFSFVWLIRKFLPSLRIVLVYSRKINFERFYMIGVYSFICVYVGINLISEIRKELIKPTHICHDLSLLFHPSQKIEIYGIGHINCSGYSRVIANLVSKSEHIMLVKINASNNFSELLSVKASENTRILIVDFGSLNQVNLNKLKSVYPYLKSFYLYINNRDREKRNKYSQELVRALKTKKKVKFFDLSYKPKKFYFFINKIKLSKEFN